MANQSNILGLCVHHNNYIQHVVREGGGKFALNQSQCTCLVQTLEQIIGNIDSIFSHAHKFPNSFDLLLKELFRLVENVKLLVQDCYGEKWWHGALLQIHNEEAFQDLLMDLKSCYDDIIQHFQGQWVGQLDQHNIDISFSQSTMQELGVEDHRALVARSRATIESTCSPLDHEDINEELMIAKYLLDIYDDSKGKFVSGEHPVEVDARLGWEGSILLRNGAYGSVRKTTWLGLPCAMKVQVLGEEMKNGDKMFKKEVGILASANHPNVVKFICCGRKQEKSTCFIAMELLDTSLEEWIEKLSNGGRKTPFAIEVTLDIMLQIAKGMSYLHEKQIAHRDLKPANVLVRQIMSEELHKHNYVNVKLADFGLSKTDVNSNISEQLSRGVGTYWYKAPELFPKTKESTKNMTYWTVNQVNAQQADAYSFGVMCARIISGRKPFEGMGDDLPSRLRAGERPWLPSDCPEALVSLVKECWSWDRTKRPKFKEICTTLKDLRSSILKDNVALTNKDVGSQQTVFQKALCLPANVMYSLKRFWKKSNLEAKVPNEAQHTSQIRTKGFPMFGTLAWGNRILPSQVWSIDSLPSLPIHFVNIDKMVSNVLFQLESNQIVGIIGMGGSGKTTLTKAVLHRVHQGFEATSFVANMRDSKSVLDIQRQLLKDLKCESHVSTIEEGFKCLQNVFEGKKIFVVFDDVASQEQLHALVSSEWVFAKGSKIIATSRNWQDLKTTCVSHTAKMEMELLDAKQAKELFYKHAFSQQGLEGPQFEKVGNKVIEACGGLPLSLEVLGSYLCGVHRPRVWEQTLIRLQRGQCLGGSWDNERIWRTLRISYDNLNEEEKNMFLDIACFFCRDVLKEGMQEEKALRIWDCDDGQADLALLNLMERSLVRVDSDGMLTMHDHLRDMGRMIGCKEHEGGQRIWNLEELKHNKSNACMMMPIVEGLYMNGLHCNCDMITRMDFTNIRLLHINNCKDVECLYKIMNKACKLRWIRICMVEDWRRERITAVEPSFFIPLKHLCVLEMQRFAHLQNLPLEIVMLKNLEYLSLAGWKNLEFVPHSLGCMTSLVTLDLSDCSNLKELPETLGNLTSLVTLDLSFCSNLKELPETLGNLTSLVTLDLSFCSNLKELPETLGNLTSLVTLKLRRCSNLKELPETLGNLTSLVTLKLRRCSNLKELPETLGNLTSLVTLKLHGCSNLKVLPETLGNLTSLVTLELWMCSNLKELPETLGNLTSLVTLNLGGCSNLKVLPETLGNLTSLVTLNLGGCSNLKALPETLGNLTSLVTLDLSDCSNLKELPETLGNSTSLVTLDLSDCSNLKELPETLGNLTSVVTLELWNCSNLKELPETLGNLTSLVTLELWTCSNLKELPETLGNLTSLVTLQMWHCSNLKELPETLGNLTSLVTLQMWHCSNLKELPETLGNLTSLVTLNLGGCSNLKVLPETLGNLTSLVTLDLSDCSNLKELPETLGNLTSLYEMNLKNCSGLKRFPRFVGKLASSIRYGLISFDEFLSCKVLNLNYFCQLEAFPMVLVGVPVWNTLTLYGCVSLSELQFTQCKYAYLTNLCLGFCTKLTKIPNTLGEVSTLVSLDLSFCKQLKEIPHTLGNLMMLKNLDLRCCESMIDLPWALGNLTSLVNLNMHACISLKKLPISLGKLISLVTFDLGSCVNLEEIPSTLNALTSLEFLIISGCWKLKGVPLRWLKLFHVEIMPYEVENGLAKAHGWSRYVAWQQHVGQSNVFRQATRRITIKKGKEIN